MAQTLVLDTTTKTLKVKMGGAAATTNPGFVATWADNDGTTFTEGATDGALNGTSDVTLIAAPAASTRRVVKSLTIENCDTAPVSLTIMYDNNGTQRTIAVPTLAVGDSWTTDGTYDNTGGLKTVQATGGALLAANNLSDVASAATARTNLGVGTGNSPAFTGLSLSGLTASEIVITDGSKNLASAAVATYPSLTELSYVKGLSSAVQTQLNSKGVGDMTLAGVQSVTGLKTFDPSKIAMKGSSTGVTTLATANAGASDFTATLQAATGTLALTSDIPSLTGYVNTTGTPVNNQLAIFTDADTVEGDASLTYDGTSFNLATAKNFQIAGSTVLADAAGTTTLSNIDALDATTEATIEGAIDTLANLTSIQGRTVTLADAGANAIFGWDDVAGAYENLTQGEVRAVAGLATTDSPEFTALNVGHASDSTITRVSAGVLAIEGVNIVTTALTGSTTQAGIAEAAIASEVNTGTDAARYVSPDALAGSNLGIRYLVCVLNGTTALTTSDKFYVRIPAALTGMNLVSVAGAVGTGAAGSSSSGTPTFTVRNVTDNQQMLSTNLTIDANEYTSATAATAAVINTSFDDVVTDDLIEVACTVAGTGVTYATITLGWQLP